MGEQGRDKGERNFFPLKLPCPPFEVLVSSHGVVSFMNHKKALAKKRDRVTLNL